jgi:cell division protein FtsB
MNSIAEPVNQRLVAKRVSLLRNRLNRRINYDSYDIMKSFQPRHKMRRESLSQGLALLVLLLLGLFAIAGPSGILAWSDNQRLLELREAQVASLEREAQSLRNRVELLDPRNVDPDLAGQLLRDRLNVAHPDEMVILLN